MKIKRRKKNDRTAFWYMSPVDYFLFRRTINPERRIDRRMSPEALIARDRSRAAKFRRDFKEHFIGRLSDLLPCPKCGGPMALVHQNAVIDAPLVSGYCKCGYQILETADPLNDADPGTLGP